MTREHHAVHPAPKQETLPFSRDEIEGSIPERFARVVETFPEADPAGRDLTVMQRIPDKLEYEHGLVRAGVNYRF